MIPPLRRPISVLEICGNITKRNKNCGIGILGGIQLFCIGSYRIDSQTVLAPMAGVSDQPFRSLCLSLGAGMAVNEMVTANQALWGTPKSQQRLQWLQTSSPRVVQIAGSEPQQMADAAKAAAELGAQIVDINMGCPAKKVCNKAAGSALLRDEPLVRAIVQAVVAAVDVPVTLKIRTGWDTQNKNTVTIARIAEDSGIQALTIHGRTRACRFNGQAEYDSIAEVVTQLTIPVIANGDIDCPEKAKQVLAYTGAKAVMIGRAAQGNPWLFAQINAYLNQGTHLQQPNLETVLTAIDHHLQDLQDLYGDFLGPRIARKHLGWYISKHHHLASIVGDGWRQQFNAFTKTEEQLNAVRDLFDRLHQPEDQAA